MYNSRLLNNTIIRQVVLDTWLPLNNNDDNTNNDNNNNIIIIILILILRNNDNINNQHNNSDTCVQSLNVNVLDTWLPLIFRTEQVTRIRP